MNSVSDLLFRTWFSFYEMKKTKLQKIETSFPFLTIKTKEGPKLKI